MTNKLLCAFLALAHLLAVACDSGSKASAPQQDISVVDKKELTANYKCDDTQKGAIAHVESENCDYECRISPQYSNPTYVWWPSQSKSCITVSLNSVANSSNSTREKNSSSSSHLNLSSSSIESQPPLITDKENWKYLNPKINYYEFIDQRDGQVYKAVTIGSQTWMAENLNFDYNAGSAKSICYDNDPSNCSKYGRRYTWAAAMDSAGRYSTNGKGCGFTQKNLSGGAPEEPCSCKPTYPVRGACPDGWHLPSSDEWITLLDEVKPSGSLRFGYADWLLSYESNGIDPLGFSVLLHDSIGLEYPYARFWNSSNCTAARAGNFVIGDDRHLLLYSTSGFSSRNYNNNLSETFSVRCIKDEPIDTNTGLISPNITGTFVDDRDGKIYKKVLIGSQTWMAENLKYDYVEEGSARSLCNGGDSVDCETYGRYYNFPAMIDSIGRFSANGKGCGDVYDDNGNAAPCNLTYPVRGVCPTGWHLPDTTEWNTLSSTLARTGEDAFGFQNERAGWVYILNLGYLSEKYSLDDSGSFVYWSSTEARRGRIGVIYYCTYVFGHESVFYDYNCADRDGETFAFSVRCIEDEAPSQPE